MIKEERIFYDSTDNIKLCGLLSVVNNSDKILVLSHGLNGNKDEKNSFCVFVEKAQKQNINTFRFDYRAHGESTGIDYEMTPSKEIQDLEKTIIMLNDRGYSNIIILGASFGASIISLIDYNKFYYVKGLISWYGALDYMATTEKEGYFTTEHKKEADEKGYFEIKSRRTGRAFKLGQKLYDEVYNIVPYKELIKINLPILFVHGLDDEYIPYNLSEKVSKLCKNGKLEFIENGTHGFASNEEEQNTAIDISIDFVKEIFNNT